MNLTATTLGHLSKATVKILLNIDKQRSDRESAGFPATERQTGEGGQSVSNQGKVDSEVCDGTCNKGRRVPGQPEGTK